jgi:hypothetical protein
VSSANAGSNSADTFLGPYMTTTASTTTESSVQLVMPFAGTVSNLTVNLGTAPGSGGAKWAFTIRKAGTDTSVTCSISGGGGNTACSDPTNKVEFAAGELLSLKAKPTNSPAGWGSIRWSVKVG